MHFLYTTSLIISYKNQPLLLSQGVAALKNKIGKEVERNKQICGELHTSFRTKC